MGSASGATATRLVMTDCEKLQDVGASRLMLTKIHMRDGDIDMRLQRHLASSDERVQHSTQYPQCDRAEPRDAEHVAEMSGCESEAKVTGTTRLPDSKHGLTAVSGVYRES